MIARPVERIRDLAARERELLRRSPAEERAVDADRLATEATVESLVGRDRIIAARRELESDADVLGDVGRNAEPSTEPLPIALDLGVLVDGLVTVAQIA